jgi:hypothetical protein
MQVFSRLSRGVGRLGVIGVALLVAALAIFALPTHAVHAAQHVASFVAQHDTASYMSAIAGVGIMGALKSVSADNDSFPSRISVLQQYNALANWVSYTNRNRVIAATVASLPQVAQATTATKAKTTQATVLLNGGAVNALAATDNFWTLTGGVIAAGLSRKYLLLSDGSDAASVLASDDQAVAANCSFPGLPADGLAPVGSVTITCDATHTFTPATTNLATATGITVTFSDGWVDDASLPFGAIVPK